MLLPHNILSGVYEKPRCFLCETNKEKIFQLETINMSGSFKFNSYSTLNFEVARVYNDMITGETKINPFYDKIEALRVIYLEGFGYFEIQGPEIIGDGIKEVKSITAYSYEYTLSQKYLTDMSINTGKVDSLEVLNADDPNKIVPITLYNPSNTKLSLLHLILEKVYGWSIGHVDASLCTLSRQFEVDRESVYDFIMNEICEKFNCYTVFDTVNNTINFYAESLTSKFIGDGFTNTFVVSPPFEQVNTVSIDGYKTTKWDYDCKTGILTLEDAPYSGAHVEVVDDALTEWETDVFVTFDNLTQEIQVSYDADSIKTVLTVTYGDDADIREVNMGLPYLTDISYYYTVDWMGQDLYDAYTAYLIKSNSCQLDYSNNSMGMLEIADAISFEENRLSLDYALAQSVNETTVGTYYIRCGDAPNFYYVEVSLPADYKANTDYYSDAIVNLQDSDDGNVMALYYALRNYFKLYFDNSDEVESSLKEISDLSDNFKFMESQEYTIAYVVKGLQDGTTDSDREIVVKNFLNKMWDQIGRTPLKSLYYEPYKKIQVTNMEAGWSQKDNENYGYYYTVAILLESIEAAIAKRDASIGEYQKQYNAMQQSNIDISNQLLMVNNFTEGQLVRLSAFLREDELQLDDIVETDLTTISDSFKIKQDAMESGKIELQKLCQPQLQFSMSMANIYALPEFKPIVKQFQLGRVVKIGIRKDYIKQSRLLQVNINFDDFSDFVCEFGELTSLKTQSSIHADLLSKAISAGKTVATNSSYWSKGSDTANSIDLRLQEGLLNSIEALKSLEGTQDVSMDKWGIHLQKINQSGEIDPKQCWLVNNQIIFTDDSFKSSKTVLGEFVVDGEAFYGLLAQAIISGYIEGSRIRGGTIQIGLQDDGTYAFEVHTDGSVTMNGGSTIAGYAKEDDVNQQLQNLKDTAVIISDIEPLEATEGRLWLNTSVEPYSLMVFTNGEWSHYTQQNGGKVHTSEPEQYVAGDLWILAEGEIYGTYKSGSILKADENLNWVDATPDITSTITNIKESFSWDDNGIKVMKRVSDEHGNITNPFYVHIDSTRMGFHSVEYNDAGISQHDIEVVHIGNNSSTIQNATFQGNDGTKFENSVVFEQQINMYQPDTTTGFIWKIEQNGSLSLAITS